MTYLPLIHLGAAVGLFVALTVVVMQAVALRRAGRPDIRLSDEAIEAVADRVMQKIAVAPEVGLDDLRGELRQIRADLEWFVGDRLIEQAIALANTGSTESEISQATGISYDEVQAIRRIRRH